jgi:hypothetical protein
VTIDGGWKVIGFDTHTARDYTLQITKTRRLVFPVTVFTAMLGNVFQQWTILRSRAHVLAGCRSSHSKLLLPSQDFPVVKVKVMLRPMVQSASLPWNKAPIWSLRPDLYYCQTVADLLMWAALSDERTDLPFICAAGPRQRSLSRVRVPWDS